MKKLLLILGIVLVMPVITSATDYWTDINFTRDSVFWGQGTTPPQPNNQLYDNREFGDFIIHGYFGRFNTTLQKLNSENPTEKFIMSWRLSTSVANQLIFPRYDNIGRFKIHFFNVNTTIGGSICLQYNSAAEGETAVWTDFNPALELSFDPGNGSEYTSVIDTLLNLGSTQLRIAPVKYASGSGNKYLQVYAITISKKDDFPSSTIKNEADRMQLNLLDRSLTIIGLNTEYKATIFNLGGIEVGHFSQGEIFTFRDPGIYMVKIETTRKTIVKKVLVL